MRSCEKKKRSEVHIIHLLSVLDLAEQTNEPYHEHQPSQQLAAGDSSWQQSEKSDKWKYKVDYTI